MFYTSGASWLLFLNFFFKVWEAAYDTRGEQLCTTQVKGTTLDTGRGKGHPRCSEKAQRQEVKSALDETVGYS